jgi:tetratricopeptide (TPR) repeat protein
MRGYSGALGVRCNFCHADADTTKSRGLDFASDARDEKRIARVMMKMAREINGKLIPRARIQSPAAVRCVTCHHGLPRPETLAENLERTIEKDGVPAAQQRYRELREKYYGSGAYDFRPGSLNSVAEWLAGRKDLDGAIAIASMSVELDPQVADTYVTLGELQARKGDKTSAISSYQHALTLDPENRRAKELLKAAQAGE